MSDKIDRILDQDKKPDRKNWWQADYIEQARRHWNWDYEDYDQYQKQQDHQKRRDT